MKNSLKILALAIAICLSSCNLGMKKATGAALDSLKADSATMDSIRKDSAKMVVTDTSKKDTTKKK
jgi:hypothetical protein